jgi:pimeloyl-ACP methyl ester carboxylesterase
MMPNSLSPRLRYFECPEAQGSHKMAYWEWGCETNDHVVVCVHGLSRQGRDFDVLATALVNQLGPDVKVICPDIVGRGKSDWLKNPTLYQVPTYAADMMGLLAALAPQRIDWIGTSMGGLIGMALAGQTQWPMAGQFKHLVLNDVGPVIEWAALERIGGYLGNFGFYPSIEAAADYLKTLSQGFGPHTPSQWMALSEPMVRAVGGQYTLHYDPSIADGLRALTPEQSAAGQAALWALYDGITAKTLVVRGADSDLLTSATAHAMQQRGPKALLKEFAGVGHAPTFLADDQVAAVVAFLQDRPN